MSTRLAVSDDESAETPADPPTLMSAIETADYLGLSAREMEKMRRQSHGPCYLRVGQPGKSKVAYLLEDVKNWKQSRETGEAELACLSG